MGIQKWDNGSFKVRVMVDRKYNYLGYFTTYEKALEAYKKAKESKASTTGRKLKATHN
jgi:hypothetical protein